MVTARNKLGLFNPQRFGLDKDPDAYRIFCVGGSTTYGRPYNDMTSFCGWLRAMLPKADPTRKWEVINAGGISYASYRAAMLMEELIDYKPDLFIIYSGQNEFLEHRTYEQIISMPKALRGIGAITSKTRIYTVVKHIVERLSTKTTSTANEATDLLGEVNTILENTVGTEAYHRDRKLQEQIVEHYHYNLMRMIDIARSVDARAILVRPASKLRNCSPFKSQHRNGLSGTDLKKWQILFDSANKAYASGRWNDALEATNKAFAIDDQYADLYYLYGRVLWQLKRYDQAKKAFIRAKDEDICPLRALTTMENIVLEVATRQDVPLVDFIALTEKYSEHATAGEDLFLDHVHPTIEGNRLLALALLEMMSSQGIVHPAQTWNDMAMQQVKEGVESYLDTNTHAVALCNIAKLYAWCGKFEDGYRLALRAIEMSPTTAEAYSQAAVNVAGMRRIDEAINYCRQSLRLKPDSFEIHNYLGGMLAAQGKLNEAISHYRLALGIKGDYSKAHNNLGHALQSQGKLDEAIHHYRQALQAKPYSAKAHNNLGAALKSQGKIDEAIGHYYQALKTDPDYAEPHYNLALTFMAQSKLDEALGHFQQVRRIKGDWPEALAGIAWVLATHPDDQKRDPKQAIALGEYAVKLSNYKNTRFLDILAMAYASEGRFGQAVTTAKKALSLASAANADKIVKAIERRLELYKQGKPYLRSASK
jgi:tetratricopeptide (TPR) repeat protein